MFYKKLTKTMVIAAMAMVMSTSAIAPTTVLAVGAENQTESKKQSDEKQDDRSNEEMEKRKAKIDAVREKWDKLSAEKKADVYKLLEDEKAARKKVLDKMEALGIMEEEDVKEAKSRLEEHFAKKKETGAFPFERHYHRKDKPDGNKKSM